MQYTNNEPSAAHYFWFLEGRPEREGAPLLWDLRPEGLLGGGTGLGISSDSVSSVSDMADELDTAGGLWGALAGLAAFGAGAQG